LKLPLPLPLSDDSDSATLSKTAALDTQTFGHTDFWTHRLLDTQTFGHIGFWTHWLLDTLAFGHIGFWTHWLLDTLAFGHISFWTHWLLGTLAFGHIGLPDPPHKPANARTPLTPLCINNLDSLTLRYESTLHEQFVRKHADLPNSMWKLPSGFSGAAPTVWKSRQLSDLQYNHCCSASWRPAQSRLAKSRHI